MEDGRWVKSAGEKADTFARYPEEIFKLGLKQCDVEDTTPVQRVGHKEIKKSTIKRTKI